MRYLELCSIEEAKEAISKYLSKYKDVEEVDLFNAVGRVLAEDIISDIDVPPFDRSQMDGYAVKAEDTYTADEDNPITLKVVGSVKAGDVKDIEINHGECIEIATGAGIPKGANAVVMVEYTEKLGDYVKIYKAVAPHENIQYCGTDIMSGELILRKGTKLTPRDIGAIAAIGKNKVKVYKKLNIGIISTGNEIISPGEKLEPYKIYDINAYTLASSILEKGWNFKFYGIVRDDKEELKKAIENALKENDIVLLSGGTSAGVGDLTESAIKELGGEVLIHGIKIKPGKPTIVGVVNDKLVVGLPGYPTSCLIVFDVLFNDEKKTLKAFFPMRHISAKGRTEYLPVSLVKSKNGYSAYSITKGSGAITSLSNADGYVVIEENREILENEDVEVHLLGDIKVGLNIIGSHCIGVDVILKEGNIFAKTINVGSLGGIMAIKRGEADIAGIHLLDNSGEYNIPFIKKYKVRDAVLVRGYIREQGFMFKRDNIDGIEDIIKNIKKYKFINRNKGSGTRILFDKFLKEHGINKDEIDGYGIEAKTHSAVAVSIVMGKADIGMGIRTVAEQYGLRFIPIAEEHYDFLIRKEKLDDEDVKKFIETLKKVKLPFKKPENCGEIIFEC
ncbi:molybdopterin biosynthesis protein [Methanotorris igneus]|uniref:Molybdenum cofactor synthesis domain protein n=1 Tax=Methanotorris igneus (strain DSM 5666 / JCM 11834 / Kol 5) TaxID=880724 RepID=F6BBX2_METIK|nr:molybdopterin biosynthesis protein [Methanotorris igneus]AEF97252.1 molybdenum cofactor synthesis domain protein [Methanotorris igneus Kol 5]